MKVLVFTFIFLFCGVLQAQNLLNQTIRSIPGSKRSIYLTEGIFQKKSSKVKADLIATRYHYDGKRGYERVVFDFSSKKTPNIYGQISSKFKKIYIDFFDTKINRKIYKAIGNSKFVEGVNFYPLSKDSLSVEIDFKKSVSVDIFYQETPGRFVIDIKE